MKALILTGGLGSRLQPITKDINKCVVPVNGKPLIDYSLDICDSLASKHLIERDGIIITGYRESDIWNLHSDEYKNLRLRFRKQAYPKCVGAIKTAEDLIDDDYFLLMLGDEVFKNPNHNAMFKLFYNTKYNGTDLDGIIGYVKGIEDEVKKTYTINYDYRLNKINKLIEKPTKVFNAYVGTGNCILPKDFFNYIPKNTENLGAGDFVSIVDKMINEGHYIFDKIKIADSYVNVNTIEDLDRAERMLK